MKITTSIILCLLFTTFSFSQIVFEKGYFIKNSGERIECLIKNEDWQNNPNSFKYKLSQDSQISEVTIREVSEFNIIYRSKFKRFNVAIDRSSSNINELSNERAAKFKNEILFLRVLVEGASNLFSYENGNIKRFFFNLNQNNVKQLIYKLYNSDKGYVVKNYRYKQQLINNLKNDCITIKHIKNINYYEKELVNLFLKYNNCNSNSSTTYIQKKQKREAFNLTIRPRINSSFLSIDPPSINRDRGVDFDNELSLRFGIELEYVLPFNKNKWSIIMEPTFQNFNSETTQDDINSLITTLDRTFIANYKSIELPIGLRHSFYLSKKTKLFINTLYVIDFSIDSEIEIGFSNLFDQTKISYSINTRSNLAFGLGTKHNKFSAEFRYGTSRNLFSTLASFGSSYKTASLIFGYTLF